MKQNKDIIINVLSIAISLVALFSSIVIGKKQVEISQAQSAFQNKVELYVLSAFRTHKGLDEPIIVVKNLGNNVIYLEKFVLNGSEHLTEEFIIPPVTSEHDACYIIAYPQDGTDHVSFQIVFRDWNNQAWNTTGYSDLIEGSWKLTYSPCEKMDKT